MNWSFGAGWLAVVMGLACAVLVMGWWRDRRRAVALQRQTRLRGEAESDRLRLRISALKPVENRAAELATELAGLRPVASRVPDLERQLDVLRSQSAETNHTIVDLEREVGSLRPRAEEADELELELAGMASRVADLERELQTQGDRLAVLERTEAALRDARREVEWLTDQLRQRSEVERETGRQLAALTEAVTRQEEAATLALARADAAETLIGRRDEIILALESRLAQLPADEVTGRSNGSPDLEPAVDATHRDDLQRINGIGPVMERRLNELGIQTWEQLAGLTEGAVEDLSNQLPGVRGRIERDGWVAQAAELVDRRRSGRQSLSGR